MYVLHEARIARYVDFGWPLSLFLSNAWHLFSSAAKRFDTDLMPRKSSIKIMIQDELTKLADEEDDEEDEGEALKDAKKPSTKAVKAWKHE